MGSSLNCTFNSNFEFSFINIVDTSSPTPPGDHSIQAQDVANSILNTGSVEKIEQNIYNAPADSLQAIQGNFEDYTSRALRTIRPRIAGLSLIKRDEVGDIEKVLQVGDSVLTLGNSGSGKSGLAHQVITNAKGRGQSCLLLDSRDFQTVQTEQDVRRQFSLQTLSLPRACLELHRHFNASLPFLLAIDQLDSVAGTQAGHELVQLALDCQGHENIDIVVFSRQKELQEVKLLHPLYQGGFQEVQCAELSNAAPYLDALGIGDRSAEIERMACNLLNLSVIALIATKEPSSDFRQLTSDVALWEKRLDIFARGEGVAGDSIVAELTNLAEEALKSEEGVFRVSEPPLEAHRRLLSAELVQRRGNSQSCVCLFAHENLQDFLYARRTVQNERDEKFVLSEIPKYRAQNVLNWMDRIAKQSASEQARTKFLRGLFNV